MLSEILFELSFSLYKGWKTLFCNNLTAQLLIGLSLFGIIKNPTLKIQPIRNAEFNLLRKQTLCKFFEYDSSKRTSDSLLE